MRGQKMLAKNFCMALTGLFLLMTVLLLMPISEVHAKENGVTLEGTGTLILYGEFTKSEVWKYTNNSSVIKIEAMDGAVLPKDSNGLFTGFQSVTNIDLSKADASLVTDAALMFYDCASLVNVNLSGLRMTNCENLSGMFWECNNLKIVDLSGFDTSKVNSMAYMFGNCESLEALDLSHFDVSNCKNLRNMFAGCMSLTSLDLSHFDTYKVTDMQAMFGYCINLQSLDVKSFNTENVTNMAGTFSHCYRLTELDLSGFDTSKVVNMEEMFMDSSQLKKIYVSSNWDISSVTASEDMFYGCTSLVGGNGTAYDESKTGKIFARIDGINSKGYLTEKAVPQFTENLEGSYVCALDESRQFSVAVDEQVGRYAYKWYVIDDDGRHTMAEATEKGWIELTYYGSHYDETYYLNVKRVMGGMDGKRIACYIKGANATVKSTEARITIDWNTLSWFEFDFDKFDSLLNMYKEELMPSGADMKSWEVIKPYGAKYSGELRLANCYNHASNLYNEMTDGYTVWPGDRIKFSIVITPDAGYSINRYFKGTIHGMQGNTYRVTGGVEDESQWSYVLELEYDVPLPENGLMVPSVDETIAVPVAGEEPATAFDDKGRMGRYDRYTVLSVEWVPDHDTFQAGRDYKLVAMFEAKAGYGFYNENEFYINNQKMTVEELVKGEKGTAKASYVFHVDGEAFEITKQPVDWYGQYGQKASFSVEATGDGLTYCWQYKKSGQWTDYQITSYDTPNFKVTMNEKNVKWPLRCKITDASGEELFTNEVRMGLLEDKPEPIVITKQPVDWYGAYGKKATFTVEATGNALTYQWQYKKSGSWIDYGVTTADTPNFKVTMNEKNVKWPIRCLLRDADGNELTTNEVWMKELGSEPEPEPYIELPVVITKQPVDWYGQYGKKASFSVEALGQGLSYQWQYKKGTSWSDYAIATADTANFTVSMNEKNVKWAFRCVITDEKGNTVITNEVWMRLTTEDTVLEGITITSQPSDWHGKYGQKASFNVSAKGEGLSYRWQYKKGTAWSDYSIATADTANFKVTMNEKNVKWAFRCVITDAKGNVVTTNEVRMVLSE